MTNEELQTKLDSVTEKLKKATEEKDLVVINRYVGELNSLWDKASVEMLENAKNNGVYTDNGLND
tara:strand:+ start:141 stop:335 length:195 start_codon:yes stop_codon:yes gene_type:complete